MKEIKNIIKAYDAIDQNKIECALATVVNVEESSYRRIGARMLVESTGVWTGGISGGCLEGDALKRSQLAIFKKQISTVVYDTTDDDANQIGVGLGCNGTIEVLFTPIDFNDINNPIEQLRKIVEQDKEQILVQVIESPEDVSLLGQAIQSDKIDGNLSIANVDSNELSELVQNTRLLQRPQVVQLRNRDEQPVKLLVEYIRPSLRIVIIGDNYDVNTMTNICMEMGWKVTIVGRLKKISKVLFQKVHQALEYEQVESVELDAFTAVVFMTHDFNWDKKLLPYFLKNQSAYIGMLGPRKRLEKMNDDIDEFDLLEVKNLYSPIGLDIGAESPEEIALSICSEIIAVFRNRTGQFLKWREGPIHERVS
jgi:xanthine/CO dehydrogenase XdhC/CoxF family maturation factor